MNYEALSEQGPLLIISHGDFLDEMQSFVDWKTIKEFQRVSLMFLKLEMWIR